MFAPGPVVVAVSGGADSTALLLILADLADELGIVIHVAHFDHRTRPKQSAEDAAFVAKLATRMVAGMRPLREGIARPLLAIGREDTLAVCRAARIRPRTDPTNRSLKFARNRVRLEVLPKLAKINPRASEAIARFAEAAAEQQTEDDVDLAEALARARDKDATVIAALAPMVR